MERREGQNVDLSAQLAGRAGSLRFVAKIERPAINDTWPATICLLFTIGLRYAVLSKRE